MRLLGIDVKRLLTDNGSGYSSKMFSEACQTQNLKHIFTKPYTLHINGKAERFMQTLLCEGLKEDVHVFRPMKYVSRPISTYV